MLQHPLTCSLLAVLRMSLLYVLTTNLVPELLQR